MLKTWCKSMAPLAIVAAALVAGQVAASSAQAQMKPIVVVSHVSVNESNRAITQLAEAAGVPEWGQMAGMWIEQYSEGLDKTKPMGFTISTDGVDFPMVGFAAVTDFPAFIAQFEDAIGEAQDLGDGYYEIQGGGPALVVRVKDGWMFASSDRRFLENVPANPAEMLQGMEKEYEIGVRAYVQNIPPLFRQLGLGYLRAGVEQGLQKTDDETEEQYQLRRKMVQNQMKQFEALFQETDMLTMGWKVDATGRRTYIDFSITAVPGSSMAERLTVAKDAKTDFAGFRDAAHAVSLGLTSPIHKDDVEQYAAMLASSREQALAELDKDPNLTDEQRPIAKELVGDLFDLFRATSDEGTIDGGACVRLEPGKFTVLGGMRLADGKKVEQIVRKLAELAKNEPDFPGVNFNAGQHAGVTFHTMQIPVPAHEREARNLIGETLDVVFGTGDKAAYFAAGHDAMDQLKSAIDASAANKGQAVLPGQMTFALTPIFKFVDSLDNAPPQIATLLEALESAKDKDRVVITSSIIENGSRSRIEIEEGVLSVLGAAAMNFVPQGGNFFDLYLAP